MLRQLPLQRWGNHGLPRRGVIAGTAYSNAIDSYSHGAWYPVGGPQRFVQSLGLLCALRAANCAPSRRVQPRSSVAVSAVCGLHSGDMVRAPVVVSAMGAANTARALLREAAPDWQAQIGAPAQWQLYRTVSRLPRATFRRRALTAPTIGSTHLPPGLTRWTGLPNRNGRTVAVCLFWLTQRLRLGGGYTAELLAPCSWEGSSAGKFARRVRAPRITKPPNRGLSSACWPSSSGCSRRWLSA